MDCSQRRPDHRPGHGHTRTVNPRSGAKRREVAWLDSTHQECTVRRDMKRASAYEARKSRAQRWGLDPIHSLPSRTSVRARTSALTRRPRHARVLSLTPRLTPPGSLWSSSRPMVRDRVGDRGITRPGVPAQVHGHDAIVSLVPRRASPGSPLRCPLAGYACGRSARHTRSGRPGEGGIGRSEEVPILRSIALLTDGTASGSE